MYVNIGLQFKCNLIASKDMRGQRAKCRKYVDLIPFVSISTNTFRFIFAKTLILHLLKGNSIKWKCRCENILIYYFCLTTKPLRHVSYSVLATGGLTSMICMLTNPFCDRLISWIQHCSFVYEINLTDLTLAWPSVLSARYNNVMFGNLTVCHVYMYGYGTVV